MINATNTSTAPSTNPARMSVVVRAPATPREPAQSERTDRSSEVRDVQRGLHHHAHRGRHRESAEPSNEAFATLKVKIQQTVSSLMDKGAGAAAEPGAESAAPASGGVLRIKAKFEMSGPEGSIEARMKIRLDAGSADAAAGFAAVMQSFAETLYAALQTLYGGAQASPPAGAVTPPPAGAPAALPATSPAAAAPASPAAAAPPPAVATPVVAEAATAAAVAANSTAVLPPAVLPLASAVTPSAAGSDAANASRSLTVKLRLTYDAFGSSLGTLVNQLAQLDVSNDRPDVSPLLGDLAERFARMMSLAPGAGSGAPSLNTFLSALSRSFFGVGADMAQATTPASDTAPGEVIAPAAPPSQAAIQRFTAMAEYRQVFSFGTAA
ncbi:MAG TPA: hypothetical protein VES39_03170 [Rhodospirillales bacterium]|nr:hypothetical protein [Rhodospirillales bacterium]